MNLPSAVEAAMNRGEDVPERVRNDCYWGICHGTCRRQGECRGATRLVRVDGWGWFSYCETAIACDLSHGFALLDENDEEIEANP